MEAEGMLPFFDELDGNGVGFDNFDPSQLGEDRAGSESPSYPLMPVTLATLNNLGAENEGFLNSFEDGEIFDAPFHTDDLGVVGDMRLTSNLRSPSPMSMTASVSGSEPYSLCSPNRSDVDDAELFELLQDSGIQVNDTEVEATPTMPAEPAMPQKSAVRRRKSNSSSSILIRGVSQQSGPWCKTKNRNNSKNAIAARENRQKKKQYILSLEGINAKLTEENTRMKKESAAQKKKITSLEREVCYLHKVLFNQSALAGLLKRLNQREVRLSSDFSAEKSPEDEASTSTTGGGICLHTNGDDTYLRFCSSCARKDQSQVEAD